MDREVSILIADDNKNLVNIMKDYINKTEGMHVSGVAYDGAEALEMIEKLRPDIVILDIIMPKLDGIGVLEKVRALYPEYAPIFIVLTAIGQDTTIQKALGLGAEYYIMKPFDMGLLVLRIKQILGEGNEDVIFNHENSKKSNPELEATPDIINEDKVKELIDREIAAMLQKVCIAENNKGYNFIKYAIELIIMHPHQYRHVTKDIYPAVSKRFNASTQKVERVIRSTISNVWIRECNNSSSLLFDAKKVFFKKKPTNLEFLFYIADNVKLNLKQKEL